MRDFEKIEAYLLGRLPEDEKKLLENGFEADPDLKKEMEEIQRMILGIETQNLKDQLNKAIVLETGQQPHGTTIRQMFRRWSVAASLLILISVGLWFYLPSAQERQLASWMVPEPGLASPMSATKDYLFHDAMIDYKQGNYQGAAEKWSSLLNAHSQNDTLIFYLGSALLFQKEYPAAISQLEKITENENSVYRDKSRWYWSLAQLQQKNRVSVRQKWQQWEKPEDTPSMPYGELWKYIE